MRHSKSGQNMALSTVIAAALVLIVFLVLLFVFTGGISRVKSPLETANNCEPQNQCVKDAGECTSGTLVSGLGCDKMSAGKPSLKPYCCVKSKEV